MKLTKINLKGFKNLKNINLQLDSILSFVSVNNYGKSNLLQSLDFAFEFIGANDRARTKMMGYYGGIPLNTAMDRDNFFVQIEGETSDETSLTFRYGFEFVWKKNDGTGSKIVNEWLDIREVNSAHFKKIIDRKNSSFKKSINTTYKNSIKLSEGQLIIDYLTMVNDLEYADIVRFIKNIKFNYCSLLDANPSFEPMPFHFIDEDDMVPYNDTDIPRALYFLSENMPEKFKDFKSAIFRLFPEFEDLSFSKHSIHAKMTKQIVVTNDEDGSDKDEFVPPTLIEDKIYQIFIKSKYLNQAISMEMMSAGTKRVFWLLLNVLRADEMNVQILALEELETSIHPGLLKNLLEEISMLSDNLNILISSHSTNILQYLKPQQLYIGIPNNEGLAEFLKIRSAKFQKLKDLAFNLGMSYGEFIFNYLSQNDDDKFNIVRGYLENGKCGE